MTFFTRKRVEPQKLKNHNHDVPLQKPIKILGITSDAPNLTWKSHIENITIKFQRRLNLEKPSRKEWYFQRPTQTVLWFPNPKSHYLWSPLILLCFSHSLKQEQHSPQHCSKINHLRMEKHTTKCSLPWSQHCSSRPSATKSMRNVLSKTHDCARGPNNLATFSERQTITRAVIIQWRNIQVPFNLRSQK